METLKEPDESNENFEKLETLKLEFQIKIFNKAIVNLTSPEAKLALEIIKSCGY